MYVLAESGGTPGQATVLVSNPRNPGDKSDEVVETFDLTSQESSAIRGGAFSALVPFPRNFGALSDLLGGVGCCRVFFR